MSWLYCANNKINSSIRLKLNAAKAQILLMNGEILCKQRSIWVNLFGMLVYSINKCFEVLWVGVGVNAVAEVRNVATSTELQQHFFHQFWYVFLSKQIRKMHMIIFSPVIHNYRYSFLCVWSNHSNDMVKLLRCVCPSAFLLSFTVFYCTSCIAFFFSFTYTVYLSVCLLFMFMGRVAWFE